jgi:signal peptidase I
VRWLSNALLLGCVAVFLLLAVGPHLFHYRTATMLTGSMEPGISSGDVVVTAPRPAADVAVGDVISYHIPIEDHRVETHRVTEVQHRADGTIAIRTKGDANEGVDPWVAVLEDDTVWEVVAVVPKAGSAIRALRQPVVQDGIFWGALLGMVPLGLSIIWRGHPRPEDGEDEPARERLVVVPAPIGRVFDSGALREVEGVEPGGADVSRRFADRYRKLLPARTIRIAEALAVGDVDTAMDAVLSLKVTSMTVGAVQLSDLARLLEERLRDEDVAGARELVDQLAPAASRAHGALTAYLAA